jgi:hypothetical protein
MLFECSAAMVSVLSIYCTRKEVMLGYLGGIYHVDVVYHCGSRSRFDTKRHEPVLGIDFKL